MRQLKIYITTTLLGISGVGLAQVGEPRNDLSVGISGGYSLNSVSFLPTIRQGMKSGFVGGLTLRYHSEKYFNTLCSVQAEANYIQLGWAEITENNPNYTYERTLNYLQIPLLTRLAWGYEQRGAMFYILLGPQFGVFLNESEKRPDDWSGFVNSRPNSTVLPMYDMKVENKFDYGIAGGAGVELNTKLGHFLLEGRYYFGLGDIFGNAKRDLFSRSAHGNIVIKASYLFDLIKSKQ